MAIEKLTDSKVRTAKPREKLYKLSDGGGLNLAVTPKGAKSWRVAYRHSDKERQLCLGLYPHVDLATARQLHRAAKTLLALGKDPSEQAKLDRERDAQERQANVERSAQTFGLIAKEFMHKREREGAAAATLQKMRFLLKIASELQNQPIREITAHDVLRLIQRTEARGKHESARRVRDFCGQIFKFAVATLRADRNPVADLDSRLVLTSPPPTHRAAITDAEGIGALWRALPVYSGQPGTRLALMLLMLTAARPGEVRKAEWCEFDLDAREWQIPAEKMKMRRPWRSPISDAAAALIEETRPLSGHSRYLFPNLRSVTRPMSDSALVAALRRMGYCKEEVSAHGFRSSFSTHANRSGLWSPELIEHQLAHVDASSVRAAYLRTDWFEERRPLVDWWAQELDRLANGGDTKVVPIKRVLSMP